MSAPEDMRELWVASGEDFEAELSKLNSRSAYGFGDDEDTSTADKLMDEMIEGASQFDHHDIEFVCRWSHDAAACIEVLRGQIEGLERDLDFAEWGALGSVGRAKALASPRWTWPLLWLRGA